MAVEPLGRVENFDQRAPRRLVAEQLAQLRIDGLDVPGGVAAQPPIGLAVVLDHEMAAAGDLQRVQHLEHLQGVLHAEVEWIGLEGVLEQCLRFLLAAHAHVEHPQAGLRTDMPGHHPNRLAEESLGFGLLVPLLKHLGDGVEEFAGVGIPPRHFTDQTSEAGVRAGGRRPVHGRCPGGLLPRRRVQQHVAGGDAAERLFIHGVQRQDLLLEKLQRLLGFQVHPGQIGLDLPGGQRPRIDFQRPAQRRFGLLDLVVLQGQHRQGRVDLGRPRIQRQGGLQLVGGIHLVVFLHEQQTGLEMGGPIGRIGLQRVGIQLVDQEMKLTGQSVPPCILRGGQSDPTERFGLLDLVIVVELDEPMVAAFSLVQAARRAIQFGLDPAGQATAGRPASGPRRPGLRPPSGRRARRPAAPVPPATPAVSRPGRSARTASSVLPRASNERARPKAAAGSFAASGA